MQQAGQTKSSVNGFGRHKLQNAKANSIRLTSVGESFCLNIFLCSFHVTSSYLKDVLGKGGGFESSPRDRLFYVTACLIGHQVEVQVLDGSVFSGILHATNADKDFGMLGKTNHLVIFLSVSILVVNFICNTTLIVIALSCTKLLQILF